jgi:hypothetical protein
MKTNDRKLTELMSEVDSGAAQLPDFQRGWVWDDGPYVAFFLPVRRNGELQEEGRAWTDAGRI